MSHWKLASLQKNVPSCRAFVCLQTDVSWYFPIKVAVEPWPLLGYKRRVISLEDGRGFLESSGRWPSNSVVVVRFDCGAFRMRCFFSLLQGILERCSRRCESFSTTRVRVLRGSLSTGSRDAIKLERECEDRRCVSLPRGTRAKLPSSSASSDHTRQVKDLMASRDSLTWILWICRK